METRKSYFMKPLVIFSLACVTAFAVACGDDDDGGPAPSGGSKAMGGTDAGGKSNNGGNSTAGKTAAMAGAGNDTAMGGGGAGPVMMGEAGMGGVAPDCEDEADMGCYSCTPKTLTQFLNACPTTGCEPFDNSALTSIKAGKLPDLP
jgi:hypothetical protein